MSRKVRRLFAFLMVVAIMTTTIFSSGGTVYATDNVTAPTADQGNGENPAGIETADPLQEDEAAKAEESSVTKEPDAVPNGEETVADRAEESDTISEGSDDTAETRSGRAVSQPVIESKIITKSGTDVGALSDPKSTLSVSHFSELKVHVHAVFPAATDKKIEIALPYGVGWNTNFNFDKSEGWVGELKKDGVIQPKDQTESDKKPVVVYKVTTGGTLTLEFQDTTEEVEFDIPIRVAGNVSGWYDTGLKDIPNAVKVTQLYNKNGEVKESVSTDFSVRSNGTINYIGYDANNYKEYANERGNIEVGEDSEQGTGHIVKWRAGFNYSHKALCEDYFVAFIAPEKAEYKGVYRYSDPDGVDPKGVKVFGPGEKFTKSTGEVYTVPAGKKLYVYQRKENLTVTVGHNFPFEPMWRFPKEDFPVGTVAEISLFDIGIKYYSPDGNGKYLPYDSKRLMTTKYEILEKKEDVYVNTEMTGSGKDWPLWEGYIADHEVYMGAPGYEHKQERTLGYFTLGNRGTGDSRPKTIIIDYDVNNTKIAGVTAQALPFLSKDLPDGTKATKVTDFKVTLWDSKTDKTFEKKIENPKQRFIVTDALGKYEPGVYIKHIEYKIDTIPAKTEFVCYDNKLDASGGAGYESGTQNSDFNFYGQVLTNDVREKGKWGDDPSLFKTRIRIENTGAEEPNWHHRNQDKWGDEVLKYPGRSYDHVTIGDTFTAFTGKSFIQGHGQIFAWHAGNPLSFMPGDVKKQVGFDYFAPKWDGRAAGQQTYKAIYYISPLGDDLTIQMVYRTVGAKVAWNKDGGINEVISPKQPDVYEVPASAELKKVYPNAKVYKADFSKFTSDQDVFDTRATGAGVYWREEANVTPYAINSGYWAYDGDAFPKISFTSDPEKDVPGTYKELLWYEYDTDTKEKLEYSSTGFVKDKWDLNGNGSTEDMIGAPVGAWEIKEPTDMIVRSAAKMATQPDSSYVTYDGVSKSGIGANNTVDYRLVATNPTQQPAKGFKVYWTVPKKGENWGSAVQPKGAFKFNMYLNGGIKSQLPAGYKVYYFKNAVPTSQALDWAGYDSTEDADTGSWTQADWDAVNLVCIESPEDGVFAAKETEEFKFNLTLHDIDPEDFKGNLMNVYAPTYRRDMGSGKGYRYGQPVAITPQPGIIAGIAWVDADNDGEKDASEASDVIKDLTVELYDPSGKLVNTAKTDDKGYYEFTGLKIWDSNDDKNFDYYTVKAYNPTDPASTSATRFVRFSPKGKNMALTAADDQKSATLEKISPNSPNAKAVDIGLTRASGMDVKKVWVEGKNADGKQAGDVDHDAVSAKLVLDGKAVKGLDGKTVESLSLAKTSTTPWSGRFDNLPVNDPKTGKTAEYKVEEEKVPEGYAVSYSYDTKGGSRVATITNTRIHGNIEVIKKDAADESKLLAGAEFELRQGKTVLQKGVTDKDGKLTFKDIPYGEYEVYETKAPSGYLVESASMKAKIEEEGKTVKVTFKDKMMKGSIEVLKKDAADESKLLAGAEFELRQGKKVVEKGVTDKDGKLVFKDVAYGEYEVYETKAPEGYLIEKESLKAKVEEEGKTVRLTFKDKLIHGKIEVLKVDANDKSKALAGAEFELRQGKKVVEKGVTDKDGKLVFKDVAYGEYEVYETKAPEGYLIEKESLKAKVEEEGKTVQLTFKDKLIHGKIEVLKVDANDESKVLAGAEFELRQGKKVVEKGVTDKEGKLTFKDVAYGEYEVYETKAPEGYLIEKESLKAKVEEEGKTIKLTFKDKPEEKAPTPVQKGKKGTPKTGDSGSLTWYSLLAGAALVLLVGANRKKKWLGIQKENEK